MSLLPDLKTCVVNGLNRANAVTVVDPNDIEVASYTDGGDWTNRFLTVVIRGTKNRPNYGEWTCTVNRIHLLDIFSDAYTGLGRIMTVPKVSTIHELLIAIGYPTGFSFPDDAIDDGNITWVNDKATVTLKASVGNPYFYSGVTLTLTAAEPKLLSTLLNRNYVTPSGTSLTEEGFYTLVEAGNTCALPREIFKFGPPQTVAEAGVTLGTYNSVVRITPIVASGYTGFYDIFFNRVNLSTHEGKSAYVPDEAIGKLFDVIDNITLTVGVSIAELIDTDINWSVAPAVCTLVAKPNSYRAYGMSTVSLVRYSEDVREITIDFKTSTQLAATTFANMVTALVATAGKLIINVNVFPDVILTSSLLTEPVFNFTKMPNYGTVTIKLKNEGTIVGRGSTSAQSTVTQAGGNGIVINGTFNGTIEIENLGTIAGGGGGGSTTNVYLNSTWYYLYGGGGQTYGAAATNNGAGNYPGINGTLTGPGTGRSLNVGTTFLESGKGGGPGEPGYVGRSMDTTSVPYISLEERVSFPRVQLPGIAISGATDKARINNQGIIRPNIVSPLVAFNEYLVEQGFARYDSLATVISITDKTKPFVVDIAATSFGTNGALNRPLGSCWGTVPGEGQSIARALVHAYPHLSALSVNYIIAGGVALVEMGERISVDFKTSVLRNDITAPAQAAKVNGYPIKRFVYYDRYLDEVMECNPYLMTAPVKWTPPA